MIIASEDDISQAVIEKLLSIYSPATQICGRIKRNGFGYLKTKVNGLLSTGQNMPIFLLTYLDRANCPIEVKDAWFHNKYLPSRFIFQVAIREIESWLLADQEAFACFSGVPINKITTDPEQLTDPKNTLLNLVRNFGHKSVKVELLPTQKSKVPVGIGYNSLLIDYVNQYWIPERAARRSPSLTRAISKLSI